MQTVDNTQTREKLDKLAADTRAKQLADLAAAPQPKPTVSYQLVEQSCDGHSWRRERKPEGGYGPWERKESDGTWKVR